MGEGTDPASLTAHNLLRYLSTVLISYESLGFGVREGARRSEVFITQMRFTPRISGHRLVLQGLKVLGPVFELLYSFLF